MTTLSAIQRGALGLATTDSPTFNGLNIDTTAGVDGQWNTSGLTVYANGVTPQHDGLLHLMSGSAGTVTASVAADELIVEGPGNASGGISILNADANDCNIFFGCPSDSIAAMIQWNFTSKVMSYGTRTASGILKFHVEDESYRGEWNTTGLTCFASGVTPQHDGVLHVMGGSAGAVTASTSANELILEGDTQTGMTILCPDANNGLLYFGNASNNTACQLQWDYDGNTNGELNIGTNKTGARIKFITGNSVEALTLNSSQQTLHTVGSVSAPSISFSGYADTGIHMVTDGSGNSLVFGSSGGEIFRAFMYTAPTPDMPRVIIANGWTGDPGVGGTLTLDSKAVRATDTGNGIGFNVPTSTSGGASEDMVVLKAVCSNSTNGSRTGDLVCYTRNTSMEYAWRAYYNGNFTVRGALAKGSGSFNIEHPHPDKKDTHRLVHGFIEGPRNDLIYRGVISMVNGWATVDLDAVSGMTSGTWVLLCRDPMVFATASGWAKVRGTVVGATLTLESDDKTYSELANWIVIAERHDEHIMDVNTTDDEGHLIVEPLMTEEQLIARERTRAAAEARAAEAEAEAATIH